MGETMVKVKMNWQFTNRDDLAGQHPWGLTGVIISFILTTVVLIADGVYLKWTIINYGSIWIYIILANAILMVSAIMAKNAAQMIYGRKQEKSYIYSTNVFSLVRHPLYLSLLLLYLGYVVFVRSLAAAGLWIVSALYFHYLAVYEEKLLLKKFGAQYQAYQQRVGQWVPIFKKNSK